MTAARPVPLALFSTALVTGLFLIHLTAGTGPGAGTVAALAATPLAMGLAARACDPRRGPGRRRPPAAG